MKTQELSARHQTLGIEGRQAGSGFGREARQGRNEDVTLRSSTRYGRTDGRMDGHLNSSMHDRLHSLPTYVYTLHVPSIATSSYLSDVSI